MLGLLLLHLYAFISRKLFWTQDFLDNHSLYLICVLHDIEGVRIPCLCILYSNANILNYARTLGSFLISFRTLYLSYHDIFFCPIGSLIACFICWSFLHRVIFLQSLILNIVWFPSSIRLIPLILWKMHTLGRNSYYIGFLNFSPILALVANGGEV